MPVGGHMTQSGDEGTQEHMSRSCKMPVCVMWWGGQGAHIECRCALRV